MIFKRKGRKGDPGLIKLPIEYMRQLKKRFGDLSNVVYHIETLHSDKLLITPKLEQEKIDKDVEMDIDMEM